MTGNPERTLVSLLQSWGERGERTAIVAFRDGGSDTWSYARLVQAAGAFSQALLARGVSRLEPVVICARNSPEWVIAYFGILQAGALPVPVNDIASVRELTEILTACGAHRIVTTSRHLPEFRSIQSDLEFLLLDGEGGDDWRYLPRAAARPLPQLRPRDPASLLWTSGTTGTPKGVPLTHCNFLSNLDALVSARIAESTDRVLLPLPLHHAYPFTVGLLYGLSVGAAIILPSGITGPEITEAARRGRATAIVGVPRLYLALLDAISTAAKARGAIPEYLFRLLLAVSVFLRRHFALRAGRMLFSRVHAAIGPKIRILASGGAHLDAAARERLEGLGYEVLSGYGLTETSPVLTMTPRGRGRIGAEGIPPPGIAIKIEPEPGQPFGEVMAMGPGVFSGYWKNEAATKAAFTPDGWFRTGDLGFLDSDNYLYITGRKSEMIALPGGEKIFPEDVEALYGAIAAIRELAILEDAGKLVALVVPNDDFFRAHGAARIEALLREELETAGLKLASYARISGFAVTREALPRTHLGKLKRHLLPGLYARARMPAAVAAQEPVTEADRLLLAKPMPAAIHDWFLQRYPGKRVGLDSMLQIDLGIDSLEWVTLTLELQDRFGIALTERELSKVITLRDLIETASAGPFRPSLRAPAGEAIFEAPGTSRWLKPQGPLLRALGVLFYYANRAVMRAVFRLKVFGVERMPSQGPLIIAPNHASMLDPFFVAAALPLDRLRHTFWAGWTGRLFWNPLLRAFSRATRIVPVDAERAPAEGLAFGLAVLSRGEALVWFPEGRLSPTGEIGPFLRGVGYLLAQSQTEAVPVRISGSFEAMPHGWHWPRRVDVSVHLGEPAAPAELEAAGRGPDSFTRIADGLCTAVLGLGQKGSTAAGDGGRGTLSGKTGGS